MEDLVRFIYEVGQTKRVRRSGWWIAGVLNPESVAEHSFRVAVIGYTIAVLEKADISMVITMCLFHDLPETRLNDIHKIGQRYFDLQKAEDLAFSDQIGKLPEPISVPLRSIVDEFNELESLESKIAHDADKLECLFQAREYYAQGYSEVTDWINGCGKNLKTESAKKIAEKCMVLEPQEWWKDLKV